MPDATVRHAPDAAKLRRMTTVIHLLLLGALLVAAFLVCFRTQYKVVGKLGFAMDDAWIHVAVAKNWISGLGWGIVPGKPLSVSTSPTWTILVGLFLAIFSDPVWAVYSLSFLCMIAATLFMYLLVEKLTGQPWLALLAAILLLANPLTLWGMGSGMELPLALAVLCGALYAYYTADPDSTTRRIVAPFCLALAAISRPELFVMIPLAVLDTFYYLYRRGTPASRHLAIKTALIQGVVAGLTLLPYFAFNLSAGGHLFPTTYYAKTLVRGVGLASALATHSPQALHEALLSNPLKQINAIAQILMGHNFLLFILACGGMLAFCRTLTTTATARGALLPWAAAIIPWVMGMSSPTHMLSNHGQRYFIVFPPLAIALATLTIHLLLRHGRQRLLIGIFVILLLAAPLRTTPTTLRFMAADVDATETMYRPLGEWLKKNLKPEDVLAVNDIGVIGYFVNRDLIDVMGLASPEIWPHIQRPYGARLDTQRLKQFLREKKVDYLVVSPWYYPDLIKDSKTFQEVPGAKWSERFAHGTLISPQIVYRCQW